MKVKRLFLGGPLNRTYREVEKNVMTYDYVVPPEPETVADWRDREDIPVATARYRVERYVAQRINLSDSIDYPIVFAPEGSAWFHVMRWLADFLRQGEAR